jgi:hypothetical protein
MPFPRISRIFTLFAIYAIYICNDVPVKVITVKSVSDDSEKALKDVAYY